jgi:outer membrane lipoprotein-sorting protein
VVAKTGLKTSGWMILVMLRKITCLPLLLLLPSFVYATETVFDHPLDAKGQKSLNALTLDLAKNRGVRGNFKQTKNIAILKQPLLSSGEFAFSRSQGLYWHTMGPVNSELLITKDKLVQRGEAQNISELNINNHPLARIMTEVFSALFTQNQQTLTRYFNQFFISRGNTWQLGLSPKDNTLTQFIQQVVVRGQRQINEILIQEHNGDRTDIRFHNVQRFTDENVMKPIFDSLEMSAK